MNSILYKAVGWGVHRAAKDGEEGGCQAAVADVQQEHAVVAALRPHRQLDQCHRPRRLTCPVINREHWDGQDLDFVKATVKRPALLVHQRERCLGNFTHLSPCYIESAGFETSSKHFEHA